MIGGLVNVEAESLSDLHEPVDDESSHLNVLRANLQMLLLIRLLLLAPGVDGPQEIRRI